MSGPHDARRPRRAEGNTSRWSGRDGRSDQRRDSARFPDDEDDNDSDDWRAPKSPRQGRTGHAPRDRQPPSDRGAANWSSRGRDRYARDDDARARDDDDQEPYEGGTNEHEAYDEDEYRHGNRGWERPSRYTHERSRDARAPHEPRRYDRDRDAYQADDDDQDRYAPGDYEQDQYPRDDYGQYTDEHQSYYQDEYDSQQLSQVWPTPDRYDQGLSSQRPMPARGWQSEEGPRSTSRRNYAPADVPARSLWSPPPPPPPRKSHRSLWISLAVVAALLLVACGGVGLALRFYTAPAVAAGQFCGDLMAESDIAAYQLLSAHLQAQVTSDQFSQAAQTLDAIEGKIVSCVSAKTADAYSYRLGSSSALATLTITRAIAGALQGSLTLTSEGGAWKVGTIESNLLGVHLGALVATDSYCAALQSQNYAALYTLLTAKAQASIKQADFVQAAQAYDQTNGKVSACVPTGIGQQSGDTAASLTVTITRDQLGKVQGTLSLAVESGVWKVTGLAVRPQGQ